MPTQKENHEALKKLIYTGRAEEFKQKLYALRESDPEVARQCIEGEGDEGRGLLSWVAMQPGNEELIAYMIDEVKAEVDHQDGKGRTALSLAISYGYIENVRALISKGADIHIPDMRGNTPMHIAAEPHNNSSQLIELLCDTYREQEASRCAEAGENSSSGDDDIPPWKVMNKTGATPLHVAAKFNIEAIHALILYGYEGRISKEELNKKDCYGATPLHHAATSETGYNAQYLLMLGGDKDIADDEGEVASDTASRWDHGGLDWQVITSFQPSSATPDDFYTKIVDRVILSGEDFVPGEF